MRAFFFVIFYFITISKTCLDIMTGEEILISFPGPPLSSFKKRRDAGKRGLLQIA